VLTDDLSWDLVRYLPRVQQMRKRGTTFSNYIVADSLCCPSRATILTGQYPHNTGVLSNDPPTGGFQVFYNRGGEKATFATALQANGYLTALMGKYINGYDPVQVPGVPTNYVPPGWTDWHATGLGYGGFNYTLNENGKPVRYGTLPGAYMTDVIAGKSISFIERAAAEKRPFMLMASTFTPHSPFTPAPRHRGKYPLLRAPRVPAFNEPDVSDKARWLRKYPKLGPAQINKIDERYRKRVRSLLAIDEMIGRIQQTLTAKGLDRNTYLVFSSDNGLHMGEHRLLEGKLTAFDTDIKVPLIITGPGVPANRVLTQLAQNTDLNPTFQELGGVTAQPWVDGRSLVPLLRGGRVPVWRNTAYIEHRGPVYDPDDPDLPQAFSGNPPTYQAVRTSNELYVEYDDGSHEYYDMSRDPYQLHSLGRQPTPRQTELSTVLKGFRTCAGSTCRAADSP
jgi:arylsulfatase A-like enzyme